jgi:hypothetical protein
MADLKMIYESGAEMREALSQSGQWLEEVANKLRQIADIIDGGALVNKAGKDWSEALRGSVMNQVLAGKELIEETARDVSGAMGDLREGDSTGSNQFS